MEQEQTFAPLPCDLAEDHVSTFPERFARHASIPGFDQEKLQAATVVVVGLGAVGSVVALELALVGVGRLLLCDPDRVAPSNLSRGPLFRPSDVGVLKVDCAARRLTEIAPGIVIEARPKPFLAGVGLAELRDADLVLGCLDSRAARVSLAGRLGLVRARSIDGATSAWSGEVRPFLDPDGPCYACALSPAERAVTDAPWSCMDARVPEPQAASAPIAALVGAWMSALALRFLLGESLSQNAIVVDVVRGVAEPLVWPRASDCPLHAPILPSSVKRISISASATVAELLAALGPNCRPLAWGAVLCRLECPRGDHQELAYGETTSRPCPRCGTLLRARTSIELDTAPEAAVLSDLGVAPREILAVRAQGGLTYVELA